MNRSTYCLLLTLWFNLTFTLTTATLHGQLTGFLAAQQMLLRLEIAQNIEEEISRATQSFHDFIEELRGGGAGNYVIHMTIVELPPEDELEDLFNELEDQIIGNSTTVSS